IRRGLGKDNFLDIRSFVYSKRGFEALRANPRSKYIREGNFYAILDLPGWHYESASFAAFLRAEGGQRVPPVVDKVLGKNPVYYWKTMDSFFKVDAASDYSESGPNIVMQIIPTVPAGITKQDYVEFLKEMTGFEAKPDDFPDPEELGKKRDHR